MLWKLLFWVLLACDAGLVFLMFVLGLAAAGPSHTSPLAVVAFMLVPGLILVGSVALFLGAKSMVWRALAFVIVASPLLIALLSRGAAEVWIRGYQDSNGAMHTFRSGKLRELEAAIARNDASAVANVTPAELNTTGLAGATVLLLALRQLEQTPGQLDVLRALLKAGADPNFGKDELPLTVAIAVSRSAGPEPVRLLLDAGANVNARDGLGQPAYFAATYTKVDVEILRMVLDRGADLKAQDKNGGNALTSARATQNWKVALLLLQRGADWKHVRMPNGLSFRDTLESDARTYGDQEGLADVIRFVKAADTQ